MKLLGIMLLKNEADILELSLRKALQSFDRVFAYDNGSTDDSWKIVRFFGDFCGKGLFWGGGRWDNGCR